MQVRPFYEKRMGQEVDVGTLGDEFKVVEAVQMFRCEPSDLDFLFQNQRWEKFRFWLFDKR